MKFNEKLIELRKKAGFSQEQLGDKLDVTRQTVSKWELGETTPEMEKLIRMSEIFNISIDELIGNNNTYKEAQKVIVLSNKKIFFHVILSIIILALFIYGIIVARKIILISTLHKKIENLGYYEGYDIDIDTEINFDRDNKGYINKNIEYSDNRCLVTVETSTDNKNKERYIEYYDSEAKEAFRIDCDEDENYLNTGMRMDSLCDEYNNDTLKEELLSSLESVYSNNLIVWALNLNNKICYKEGEYEILSCYGISDKSLYLFSINEYEGCIECENEDGTTTMISYQMLFDNFDDWAERPEGIENVIFEPEITD